jgi:hypothetical protein
MPDADRTEENPYASPQLQPLRGYWSRFFPALRRAIRRYQDDMRREEIGAFDQLRAWAALLFLLALVLGIIASSITAFVLQYLA